VACVSPEELEETDDHNYEVLALDPGGTTGWALFSVHPEAMSGDPDVHVLDNVLWWNSGQFTGRQDDQIDEILALVEEWPNARLVTEDFLLRQLNAVLWPVEINAIVLRATRPRYWVKQHASLAMSTVTDDRLKAWGFWVPGKEHARDAIRHAITFLKRRKQAEVAAARATARRGS
jgi:hypothetical protein